MKDFKKDKNGLFICEECNQIFHKKDKLSYHINIKHNGQKEYFDKYLKENEGLCKICNKPTFFTGFKYYYDNCCSKECKNIYRKLQTQKSVIKIYGVDVASKNDKIKNKIKESWSTKTNEERHIIRNKIENIWSDKYGTTNNMSLSFVKDKLKKTNLERYGVENPQQNKIIREKTIRTLQNTLEKRYGVKNVSQVSEFFNTNQKNQLKLKQFRNTNISYQGSYELDFLNTFYDQFTDIERGPTIKYVYEEKNKYYHSDFFIPSLNLIIEIKNIGLYNRDKEKIIQKEEYTRIQGFNYILILEKNYNEFMNLIKNNN
jgi:hypothetical protein